MALFKIDGEKFVDVEQTGFEIEGLKERYHLQKILKKDISSISCDLMVISEEYGDWENSKKRIDLLCIDRSGDLVVVELKRTMDGGEMELQAIRYAAMISSMTPSQLIAAHIRYLENESLIPNDVDKYEFVVDKIKSFVPDFEESIRLNPNVKIYLVSADFSKELTTSVLWLNGRGLDIRLVRLKLYKLEENLLVDVQQVIPLPEAADYETKIKDRAREEQVELSIREETRKKFWAKLLQYSKSITDLFSNRSPSTDSWISTGVGKSGFTLSYVVRQYETQVECYIDHGPEGLEKNKIAFDYLLSMKDAVEKEFGDELDWQALEGKRACRIRKVYTDGGWKSQEQDWALLHEKMVKAMICLESALKMPIQSFR